jgi:DNA-binding response OmpR family regulator
MRETPLILLVEDSPTQAKFIAAHLIRHNLEVITANDGPEGLRIAEDEQPDMMVLDLHLPTMTGYQVCHLLKRNPRTEDIPVVILTVQDDDHYMLAGIGVGAVDYIPKDPSAIDNLLATFRTFGLID